LHITDVHVCVAVPDWRIIVLALSCAECQYVEGRRADLLLRVHRV
jgi:hypothetical protein